MGIPYVKQKKNDSSTEGTKNGDAKEAAANEATDFDHGKANDLSGNLKNTADTSQGPGPTQGISHHIEPNNGNEAALTSMHQVPTIDAQNREQSLNKSVNKSQDVDPVKIDPYIFTAVRQASPAKTLDRVMKIPTGANDDLSVFFKHKPPAPVVKQKTKPVQHQKRTTAPVQEQTKPVQEQTKPVQQQTKPVQQQTKPVQQQTKPVQEQTKPVQQQTKPVQQQTKPVQQQTKPVQEQTKPVQEQTKPVQQQTKPVQEQTKPVQQQTKPVQEQTKPVQQQKKTTAPVQEQTKPVKEQTKPVHQQTKPVQQQKKTTALVQQQTKPVQQQKKAPSPVLHVTVSQQRPTAKETTAAPQQTVQTVPPCDMATADSAHTSQVAAQGLCRYGSHQVEHSSQLPASVHRLYSDVVRGVPTKNLPRRTKAQIKLLRHKYSCALPRVNEVSTDLTCQATDKTHNTAEQSTATSPGMAEVPPDHSTQESESQVNINALHEVIEHCLILVNRRREPAERTVATEQESSQEQYWSAVEEITIQTHDEPQQVSKPNKADDDTNGNASSRLLKVNVEALESQVPAVEGMPTTAPNNAANNPTAAAADTSVKAGLDPVSLPQDTDVKLETKCYNCALNKNQPDEKTRNVTLKEEANAKDEQVVEEQEPAVRTEGRRHPFKVNQSCPQDVKRNPGKGLPPNVQKWCDEPPYHLCEPPWVTTARLAAFLALTKAQEEGGDPPQ